MDTIKGRVNDLLHGAATPIDTPIEELEDATADQRTAATSGS
jgi:hypothetical protein